MPANPRPPPKQNKRKDPSKCAHCDEHKRDEGCEHKFCADCCVHSISPDDITCSNKAHHIGIVLHRRLLALEKGRDSVPPPPRDDVPAKPAEAAKEKQEMTSPLGKRPADGRSRCGLNRVDVARLPDMECPCGDAIGDHQAAPTTAVPPGRTVHFQLPTAGRTNVLAGPPGVCESQEQRAERGFREFQERFCDGGRAATRAWAFVRGASFGRSASLLFGCIVPPSSITTASMFAVVPELDEAALAAVEATSIAGDAVEAARYSLASLVADGGREMREIIISAMARRRDQCTSVERMGLVFAGSTGKARPGFLHVWLRCFGEAATEWEKGDGIPPMVLSSPDHPEWWFLVWCFLDLRVRVHVFQRMIVEFERTLMARYKAELITPAQWLKEARDTSTANAFAKAVSTMGQYRDGRGRGGQDGVRAGGNAGGAAGSRARPGRRRRGRDAGRGDGGGGSSHQGAGHGTQHGATAPAPDEDDDGLDDGPQATAAGGQDGGQGRSRSNGSSGSGGRGRGRGGRGRGARGKSG